MSYNANLHVINLGVWYRNEKYLYICGVPKQRNGLNCSDKLKLRVKKITSFA